jgi:hypothetical protein
MEIPIPSVPTVPGYCGKDIDSAAGKLRYVRERMGAGTPGTALILLHLHWEQTGNKTGNRDAQLELDPSGETNRAARKRERSLHPPISPL